MKNQKIFAGIVVIALVIVAGYLFWSQKSNNINTPQGVAETATTNTSNWKTYTNSKYGFEFKYPSDYKVRENTAFDARDEISKLQVIVDKDPAPGSPNSFELNIKDASDTLSSTLSWYKKNFENVIIEQNKMGDNNFTVIKYDSTLESDGITHHYEVTYIEHGSFLFSFQYSYDYPVDLRHILSTFKFTNTNILQVSPTSGTAPLTVTALFDGCDSEVTWGDGTNPWDSGYGMNSCGGGIPVSRHPMVSIKHTYTAPGVYTVSSYLSPPPASPTATMKVTVTAPAN